MALNARRLKMARESSTAIREGAENRLAEMFESDSKRFAERARAARPSKKQLIQHCTL